MVLGITEGVPLTTPVIPASDREWLSRCASTDDMIQREDMLSRHALLVKEEGPWGYDPVKN
jgi:hypothetical protein